MQRTVSILVLAAALPLAAQAENQPPAPLMRWLYEADRAANETVTYAICGWGRIDLLTPLLDSALADGVDPLARHDLRQRFDDAMRERQRLEAVLALQPYNRPEVRFTGLFPTDGCAPTRRAEIEEARGTR